MNSLHCPLLPNRRRLARPCSVLAVMPLLDVVELDGGLCLYCNMPGVAGEDVVLEFDQGVLSLKAEARLAPLPGKVHALEFSDIVYEAKVRIPAMVDMNRIEAVLADGSLRVYLPFPGKGAPVRIPVSQE